MMSLIIHFFHSRDVVVVISQLLLVAHTIIPVPQFFIPLAKLTDIFFKADRCITAIKSITLY